MDYTESYNEANKVLTKYLEAFVEKAGGIIVETVEEIGVGVMRSTAYMSPSMSIIGSPTLISQYQRMIRDEDWRMLQSVLSLIAKPNVIYQMALTVVTFLFSKAQDKTKNNLIERRSEFEDKITDTIAKQAVRAATKVALIEVIIKVIASKIATSPDIILTSRKLVARMLTTFQIYSYFDKAALAARKLRREDKIIYDMLYSQKTEMLYFIIAKKIDPLIRVTRFNDHGNADELMYALYDVLYKR